MSVPRMTFARDDHIYDPVVPPRMPPCVLSARIETPEDVALCRGGAETPHPSFPYGHVRRVETGKPDTGQGSSPQHHQVFQRCWSHRIGGVCAYVASKHAVPSLTSAAVVEWGCRGIRVNCINPSHIKRRMMDAIEEAANPDAAAEVHDGFADTIPMNRYWTPDEVAGVVAFLASYDDACVNRAANIVDGGISAA